MKAGMVFSLLVRNKSDYFALFHLAFCLSRFLPFVSECEKRFDQLKLKAKPSTHANLKVECKSNFGNARVHVRQQPKKATRDRT